MRLFFNILWMSALTIWVYLQSYKYFKKSLEKTKNICVKKKCLVENERNKQGNTGKKTEEMQREAQEGMNGLWHPKVFPFFFRLFLLDLPTPYLEKQTAEYARHRRTTGTSPLEWNQRFWHSFKAGDTRNWSDSITVIQQVPSLVCFIKSFFSFN